MDPTIDIVSDLNDGSAETVPAHQGDTAHGDDAVSVNNQNPAREPVQQPKKVGTADEPAKPITLRDQISSALKGETDTPPAAQQDGGPARNPDGTFAAKPAEVLGEPVVEAPAVVAPTGIDPNVFKSLPAETQAELARTMDGITASQERFARLAPVEDLISQRVDAWAINGVTPAQALGQLLALSDFAGRDPGGFIKYIAQNNGVDLEELVLGMDAAVPVDPIVAAMQKELSELRGVVQGQTQQQQQAVHDNTVNSVKEFASEKGQDGTLLRPHFEELGNAVLPYIQMVKSQNPTWQHSQVLQEAYDRACWGTKSVRDKLQAATTAAAEAQRLRENAERVASARNAGVSVRSGAPSAAPVPPNDTSRSLRDTIRASIASAG